jgi:protein gp37
MPEYPESIRILLDREGTNISWSHFTFNPWLGCQKVSPACDHCYAETVCENRLGVTFGPGQERRRTSLGNWSKPLRWQRLAAAAGITLRVFCASLADWADNAVDPQWRRDLAVMIRQTPNLNWMLLTKRIGNADAMLLDMFPEGVPENVWIGITVANQAEADRDIEKLRALKRRFDFTRAFLSIEPMLGPIDLREHLWHECPNSLDGLMMDPSTGQYECCSKCDFTGISDELAIDLVIVGGESGPGARPMHPGWAIAIMKAVEGSGCLFHFKQWGEWMPVIRLGVPSKDGIGTETRQIASVTIGDKTYRSDRIYHFADDQPVVRVGVAKAGRMMLGNQYLEEMA